MMKMAISALENDDKGVKHSSIVQILARELGAPMEEIDLYYEEALKELMEHARIKAYLPILASRQVKEIVLEKKVKI
jgi:hypothetical protein